MVGVAYSPSDLPENEKIALAYSFRNSKASKILDLLTKKENLYLNEINDIVKGSKTSTILTLKKLEKMNMIESKWDIKDFEGEGGPQRRAVKVFKITENQKGLVSFYDPIFKISENIFS